MDVEVSGGTEINGPPTTSNGNNNTTNAVGGPKDGGYHVIPYGGELVASSGQRIKLQAEINSDYKFLTICDPATSLAELKTQLEIEYNDLYPTELPIVIVRLQDSRRNDMPLRFKIGDLLKDKDKIYIVIKPIINPEDEAAEAANTHAPKQRGRKRKNQDSKDLKGLDTPNKKQTLSSLSPSQTQLSPSQPPTPTQLLQQQQLQQPLSQITPYSPGAKVGNIAPNAERVVCNPYCALIETRDAVPCQHCGELRPYVVPDSEKTDRNQCSKWCVTGSTRKLKAAGLEFCSICLARHRAGKYDLRKAHQCQMCHRPWLHLDEYMFCRTCRKSAMGTDLEKKGEQKTQSIPLQQLHNFQQQSQQLLGVNSPPHHSSPSPSSGSSLPLGVGVGDKEKDNGLLHHHHHHHHDGSEEQHGHHAHDTQGHAHAEHDAHGHTHEHETHAHTHTHTHADAHSAEQLAEMVLSQIPATGQEGEAPLTNSYYDPTLPITTQEKVGS